jgi:hypothetical protein
MLLALMSFSTSIFAGSERWIMKMTADRMMKEKLIHVKFADDEGNALESDVLKQMVIREDACESGKQYFMPDDYRLGYYYMPKLVGIYLKEKNWANKNLCFTFQEIGMEEIIFTEADVGNSVTVVIE